jgi:hypothetical protein
MPFLLFYEMPAVIIFYGLQKMAHNVQNFLLC